MPAIRSFYTLTFDSHPYVKNPIVLGIRTLSRGELLDSYITIGYPGQQIPEEDKHARSRLESEVYRLGCIDYPEYEIPSGVITRAAEQILLRSGFLEDTEEQAAMMRAAVEYSRSSDARGDAIIMASFGHYGLEELHSMDYPQWMRLLMSAMVWQYETQAISAEDFLNATPTSAPERSVQEMSDPGLDVNMVRRVFGLSARESKGGAYTVEPIISGGGVITPNGHKTWGDAGQLKQGRGL